MQVRNMKQRSVMAHNFAMNPRVQVQRSSFPIRQRNMVPFSASYLVPIFLEEVHPGDLFNVKMSCACRTQTPIVPVMDNWKMDVFFFYDANRNLWENWEKFMGAQDNPGDSISFLIPQVVSPASGWANSTIWDYFGLPGVNQVAGGMTISVSALPGRMYNRVWNQWFRDQNLQNSLSEQTGNGPDSQALYALSERGKRFDYFTQALPSPQKGTAPVIPLGTTAPIVSTGVSLALDNPAFTRTGTGLLLTTGTNVPTWSNSTAAASGAANFGAAGTTITSMQVNLTAAAGAQLNVIRTAVATQQLLERDARGGTRYNETIFAHWGVRTLDFRLDRPEYIGGGTVPVEMTAIPQTSATGLTGGTTPAGNLAATGYLQGNAGFSYAATEHGFIMGLACVTADLTYSQGIRKFWTRQTRYDYPFPEFAHLGEQAILNKEIYAVGSATGGMGAADQDMQVFGYVPRYDECRHFPSMITGKFRPKSPSTISYWHSSQEFSALPTLNSAFITDATRTVIERNFAGGAATATQQFLADFMFTGRVTRALPTYGIPGLTRF